MGVDDRWVDLIDPPEEELRKHLPEDIHPSGLALLLAPHLHDDEPRPRIDSHGTYVIGVLLVAVAIAAENRLYYQEVDFVLTTEKLVTVSKTPPDEQPFDPKPAKDACHATGARRHVRVPAGRRGRRALPRPDRHAERRDRRLRGSHRRVDRAEDPGQDLVAPPRPPGHPPYALPHARRGAPDHRRPRRDRRRRAVPARGGDPLRATSTTSSCARPRASRSPATCSAACATTCRRRSPTTRTR